jgi:hypothetical protein
MGNNNTKSALPFANVLSPEIEADNQAIIDKLMTGKPLDPETYRRIRERAESITAEVRRKHGVLNIAVDLVREARDSE